MICFKKLLSLLFVLLSGITVLAQAKTVHAENVAGKLIKDDHVASYIHGFKELSGTRASSLEKTINKIYAELYRLPQLNPPMGFEAQPHIVINRLSLSDKESVPFSEVVCYFRYLVHDRQTGKVKKSLDGTDFYLELNSFDRFFDQLGNFWSECYKLNFPLFFEQLPVTDSTADYVEINFKNYGFPYVSNNVANSPIRIIKRNNKPLLIPLTRKEYLQFLIARNNFHIKDDEALIVDEKKQISETQKNSSDPLYQSVKETLQKGIVTMEGQIKKLEAEKEMIRQKITHLQEMINALSPQEAKAPARLDYEKRSDEFGSLEQLVPAGRKEGVMLTRINPEYYNKSPNSTLVQLITVYYSWPTVGFETDPDYLQQATINIFNDLDYHQLKESMQ